MDGEINEELSYNKFEQNLNDLKNWRSGGIDGVKNELLKNSGPKLKYLLFLFTKRIMETGYVPESLNEGRVKLLYKGADSLDPKNYRPITVSFSDY